MFWIIIILIILIVVAYMLTNSSINKDNMCSVSSALLYTGDNMCSVSSPACDNFCQRPRYEYRLALRDKVANSDYGFY